MFDVRSENFAVRDDLDEWPRGGGHPCLP